MEIIELVQHYENVIDVKNIRLDKEIKECAALRALLESVLSGSLTHEEAKQIYSRL